MDATSPRKQRTRQVLGPDFDAIRPLETIATFLRTALQTAIADGELPPASSALRVRNPNPPDHVADPDPFSCRNNWGLVVKPRDHAPATLKALWTLQARYNCSWPRLQDVEELPDGCTCLTWFGWFHWWVEVPAEQAPDLFEAFRNES